MDWGLQNRLARIIKPATGRTVMLAVDHGYFLGPTSRIENPRRTIEPLLPHADALMPTRGVLRASVDPATQTPIVLRVSGGTSVIGPSLADEGITTTFEEAIRLNVSAVALSIFVGTDYERQTLLSLADLVNEGQTYGIPVLAVTAVGKELEKRDQRFLSLCCRIAAELGAHLVKTYYCEGFEKVVEGCPVPVVIAGGPKLDTMKDVLQLTHDALSRGAVGVDMGRNIWQSEHPVAAIQSVRAVVHEKATVKQALDLFEDLKATRN
jgi:putative autoinducer-2 (AI-2) aldolase